MSEITIQTWVNQEHNAFENFTAVIASRMEEAIFKALTKKMKLDLASKDSTEVTLPWGTYSASLKTKGEGGNINIAWEPSKGFVKILNGDMDNVSRTECITQDEFDPEFVELFRDWVAYGFFYPNAPENKDRVSKNKGVRLSDDEINYFLNGYALVLATIAKDKQRDGKVFRLEINNGFPHGAFNFEYDDGEIKVTFVADKVFKQLLKDDEAAATAYAADFTPIRETRIEVTPVED